MKKGFILGNPRSGTSLLRLMLDAHSKISAPPECGFLHWLYNKHRNWNASSCFNYELDSYLLDLRNSKKFETWGIQVVDLRELIVKKQPSNYAQLSELVYISWSLNQSKKPSLLIDKNNYYIKHLDEINEIWSDAKFIHLVRDGRDVASSYIDLQSNKTDSKYKPVLPKAISEIAKEWSSNVLAIDNFLSKHDTNRYVVIKYEDLITNTKPTIQKILDLFSLEYEIGIDNYYLSKYSEPEATIGWKQLTKTKPNSNRIGRYKTVMKDSECSEFEKLARTELLKYSYIID